MATVLQATDARIRTLFNELVQQTLGDIEQLQQDVAGKANASSVYTRGQVEMLFGDLEEMYASHVDNDDIHISASERETWNAKFDSTTAYTKSECQEAFAPKSVETDISNLQRDKAAANNVYTKSEIDTSLSDKCDKTDYSTTTEMNTAIAGAISGKMTGTTLDLRTDDGLYAAVKAIGQALGATIQE